MNPRPQARSLTDRASNQGQSSCTLLHVRSKSIVASFSGDQLGGPELELEGWKYIPLLPKPLPLHHRLRHHNRNRKPTNSQHQLCLVEIFIQDIERLGGGYAGEEEVEAVGEDEGGGFEEGGGGEDVCCVCDLCQNK
jgi:hypothetical protein